MLTRALTAIVCLTIASIVGTCLCGCSTPKPAPAKPVEPTKTPDTTK